MRHFLLWTVALALGAGDVVGAVPALRPRSLPSKAGSKHLRPIVERRDAPGFAQGQPFDGKGKGAPLSGTRILTFQVKFQLTDPGGTNKQLDLQNPANLGEEPTDAGNVVNLKWSFSDSHTRLLNGGWVREQVITDLPSSEDIAGAQQHLKKGAIRELHWHRVAEWGFVYKGQISVFAVDENGRNQYETLNEGDIWYFPKGEAHGVQGLEDENEYLLIFDDGNFDATGTTFMVDDWITHTPKDILAKNFGVDPAIFNTVPSPNPYILNASVSTEGVSSPYGTLSGNSSYVYHASQVPATAAAGGGGTIQIVDSRNFPIATTIAAAIVTLEPGALRELHWHPNVSAPIQSFLYKSHAINARSHCRLKNGSTSRKATHERLFSSAARRRARLTSRPGTRRSFLTTRATTSRTARTPRSCSGSRSTRAIAL